MDVRAVFKRAEREKDRELVYLFISAAIVEISDTIMRDADYLVRGKRKITFTVFGLSKFEADRVHGVLSPEVVEGGLLLRVYKISPKTEEDTGPYYSAIPEYKDGARERLMSKDGYCVDIDYMVRKTVIVSRKKFLEAHYRGSLPPITALTMVMGTERGLIAPVGDDPAEMERYIVSEIAEQPMYKERIYRPRRPRHRSPRRRGSSIRSYEDPAEDPADLR